MAFLACVPFADASADEAFFETKVRPLPAVCELNPNLMRQGGTGIEMASELCSSPTCRVKKSHEINRPRDIAMIRSTHISHSNHDNATLGMHTGSFNQSRPSRGSWTTYGLGTLNRNLPGMSDQCSGIHSEVSKNDAAVLGMMNRDQR